VQSAPSTCERPTCSIRCHKDLCEKEDCPKCETVCAPAQCHTTCSAPEPKCSPVCEELECNNKCIKPTNCAKPKCELQCEKSACEEKAAACCPCSQSNVQLAISQATSACAKPACSNTPSFLEVFHSMAHKAQTEEECCPCNN